MLTVAAFYKFVVVEDPEALASSLRKLCESHKIIGTVIIASEGINGTVAGSRKAIDAFHAFCLGDKRFADLEYKESHASDIPFYRMKVKIKKEIVTLGCPEANPNEMVGTHVDAKKWHELLSDKDTVVIDVRNDYEVALGTFKNSINPKTESFRDFPQFVKDNLDPAQHKKVAMACTGGIRCEKASSLMKKLGFLEVYQLKGGILRYLENVKAEESAWLGECFVFDNRVAVKHNLELGSYDLCHGCRMPISADDRNHEHYVKGISCHQCYGKRKIEQVQSSAARQKQIDLAKARGMRHLGASAQME
jgi:UPF0176 protein